MEERKAYTAYTRLRNPVPDPLDPIFGDLLRPNDSIQCSFPGKDISVLRRDNFGPLKDLPTEIQHKIDRDADICGDKILNAPWSEGIETVEDDNDAEEDEREPCRERLPWGSEDEISTVDAVSF